LANILPHVRVRIVSEHLKNRLLSKMQSFQFFIVPSLEIPAALTKRKFDQRVYTHAGFGSTLRGIDNTVFGFFLSITFPDKCKEG
jgi:hypothetical protein